MAYVRHNWTCGEVINDTRMNNIEDGIEEALSKGGAEPLVLNVADTIKESGYTAIIYDKTGEQVAEAIEKGSAIYVKNINVTMMSPDLSLFVPIQGYLYDSEVGVKVLVNYIEHISSPYTATLAELEEVPSSATGEEAQYVGHMSYYQEEGGIS